MALDILGAGFGRTGTSSLKIALEHLGFGPCHHMFEVRDHPEILAPWQDFVAGKPLDFERAFAGYRSQVDWPGAAVWRELAARYPAAKVILTIRDPEEWYDSFAATIMPFGNGYGTHPVPHVDAIATMGYRLVNDGVFGGRWGDRQHAISVFNAHIAEVQRTIPRDRLLTFDCREGWDPLCAFLGVAVPGISFPKLNSSKQFTETEWKEKVEG